MSADDLSALMGVLVGVPQYDITEMYSALTSRGRPTEGNIPSVYDHSIDHRDVQHWILTVNVSPKASLQNILMTHPVYRKLLTDCLRFNGLTTADGNHNGIVNGMNKTNYGHKTNNHFLK